MATLEQLSAALIKADAAGNTADAKALADAIRQMRAAPALPQSLQPSVAQVSPDAIPAPRQNLSMGQRVYQAVRPYVAPSVEALGAAGGAVLGTPFGGPVGTITGAGAGYATAKGLMKAADVAMGVEPPETLGEAGARTARDVIEGATFEVGGRVLGQTLGKVAGKIMDLRNIPANKAAKLARASLGPDLEQTLNALKSAPPNASVAEITAKIQNPAWQALVRDALEKSPSGAQYLNKLATMSHDEGVNALARLVGGSTGAEVRGTTDLMKQTLTDITSPARQAALTRANLGQQVADFEAQAGKLSAQAAAKVQEVRRLIELGDVAAAAARLQEIKMGMPAGSRVAPAKAQPGFSDTWAAKYTYPGKLAQMSDDWASKAAEASLDLGQGAQFAQSAANSMRAAGIKPLKGDEIIGSIRSIANNPEFAGNDLLLGAVKNVADDIAKWSNSGGIIDAKALDAIRKNSINAAIQQLRPGIDATTQRNLTAEVMGKLKPTLIDAIEAAGGRGYRAYLEDYTKGMQQIAQKKLTGEALRLWKTDKDAFVRLVQNESEDVVEKFLGPGKYNIASELAEDTLSTLQSLADKRLAQLAASKQASDGEKALTTLLRENTSKFRLPSWLSFWGAAANKTISELEKAVGSKSMKVLAEAMQSPEGATNLLERLPAEERVRVLKLISDPSQWSKGAQAAVRGAAVTGINQLAPDRYNNNALSNQPVRIVETQP